MWTEIDTHISQVTGKKFQTQKRRSVGGGCINQGYFISDGQCSYFVKINRATKIAMFEAEALGLNEIHDTGTIRVPKSICSGVAGNSCYLVMEWLSMGKGNPKSWQEMGHRLAAMHKYYLTADGEKKFGWHINNTIGAIPQINTWTQNWVEFYLKHRLAYQFELAKRRGSHFPQAEQLLSAIPKLLSGHQAQPSLVHGDLWGGNAGFTEEGEPVIFDPATYYGDREVDIAMTELFGGFPAAFYRAYNEVFPLNKGYEKRKILYNLYHIINHFNLFGSGYVGQANSMISRILG